MSFCFAIVLPSLCHRDVSVLVHRVSEFDAVSFRVVDKMIDCRSVVYYRVRVFHFVVVVMVSHQCVEFVFAVVADFLFRFHFYAPFGCCLCFVFVLTIYRKQPKEPSKNAPKHKELTKKIKPVNRRFRPHHGYVLPAPPGRVPCIV